MVTIRFDKETSVIIVYVNIKGKEVILKPKMCLDTGTTYVMISWELAEKLGLEPELSKERIETITASGIEIVPIVYLESVKLGDKEAHRVKAIVHDLPAKSYVDGLLGLSFLRNFNLHINFKEGSLELES